MKILHHSPAANYRHKKVGNAFSDGKALIIAKNRTEKQIKARFLFQILLFYHDNGFRTYR